MPSIDDPQAKRTFEELQSKLSAAPAGMAGAAEFDFCKTYGGVRGVLKAALPFIRAVPYGNTISAAIEFLMGFADKQCKIG
jgi:hypothetical protein